MALLASFVFQPPFNSLLSGEVSNPLTAQKHPRPLSHDPHRIIELIVNMIFGGGDVFPIKHYFAMLHGQNKKYARHTRGAYFQVKTMS